VEKTKYPDEEFYMERIEYYEDLMGGCLFPDGKSSFVLAEGYKVKGFGEIEFYLTGWGYGETLKFWRDSLEWYIKTEQDRERRKYCQCQKPLCKECGKEIKK